MTAIAYCNGVMACDSSYVSGDGTQDAAMTKMTRLASGALLGGSGDVDDRELVELFDKVKTPKQFPTRKTLADLNLDYAGLLVLQSGRVYKIEISAQKDGNPAHASIMECNRGIAATGTGGHLALGNMLATASAIEGVKAACKFDPHCRPPIHVLPLKQKRKR